MGDVIDTKKEQKNGSLKTIFLVVLIISFVFGIIERVPFLILENLGFQDPFIRADTFFYFSLLLFIGFIIDRILLFFGFYHIGKKFDLKSNLNASIIRLLVGAYLGHFLSYNVAYLIIGNDSIWLDSYLSTFIDSVISLSFLGTFFVAFTALAIGYLRHNESEI